MRGGDGAQSAGEAEGDGPVDRLRYLESIVENANDAILVPEGTPIDEPGARIVYVDAAFTQTTGYALEDLRGETPRILQGPDTELEPRRRIREADLVANIAEGVEIEVQRSRLQRMECELAQRFYFSEPPAAEDAAALLEDR